MINKDERVDRDLVLLRLFSVIFFLGQRLDCPPEFHQEIFDRVDSLQAQEKAPMDWFQFYQMKLRYCHLYGAIPPHKIRVLIQDIEEQISILFTDEATQKHIRSQFDHSLFFYEKETLNHYSSAQNRMADFAPKTDDERYIKHAMFAALYQSLGRYTDSLLEYDASYECIKQSQNRNKICTYYRNKGLTYYLMREFDHSHQMFRASLELAEELQSVEAIQFSENLLSVLEFEKTGAVPNFTLQRGVPLIQNFLLVHATVQDVEQIFLAGEFVQKNRIHPSLTFVHLYILTGIQLLLDFGVPFHEDSVYHLVQKYTVIPEENPLGHAKDVLLISSLLCRKKEYKHALTLVESALLLDLAEIVDERFSLEAERTYLRVILSQKPKNEDLLLSIPVICYSNHRIVIMAIINLCIACYACEKTKLGASYMNTIRELYEKYPFTHLHCKQLQELQIYAPHIDTSIFTSQFAHEDLTEKRVIDMIEAMIALSS